jgi:hypothetical protein
MRSIRSTPALISYLRSVGYVSAVLRETIEKPLNEPQEGAVALSLDDDTAERFRAAFTKRLAQVGFGANYELSKEGVVLEDLIDRFAG